MLSWAYIWKDISFVIIFGELKRGLKIAIFANLGQLTHDIFRALRV